MHTIYISNACANFNTICDACDNSYTSSYSDSYFYTDACAKNDSY
jgi:hypothetical protein